MSSASRRCFLRLGGGAAVALLFAPDFVLAAAGGSSAKGGTAAKAAGTAAKRAVRKAQTARGGGAASAKRGTSSSWVPQPSSAGRGFSVGAPVDAATREVTLFCVHTGERLEVEYYVDGRYEPQALRAVDHLLRDYHNDEVCQFDPRVLNQLFDLRRALGSGEAFHVVSGYRSPETNESYRRAGARVAEHSYHLTGQAIDVYLPGRDIRQLRNVALAMRAGGVGYYPADGFLHVDSGPVRRW